jgi:hypothetical protein
MRCRFENEIDFTLTHQISVLSPPPPGGWSSNVTMANVRSMTGTLPRACGTGPGDRTVTLVVRGRPSDIALQTAVIAAENEHLMDYLVAFNQHLVPIHERVARYARQDTVVPCDGACVLNDCTNRIYGAVGNLQGALQAFGAARTAATQRHDGPGGNHHFPARAEVNRACDTVTVTIDSGLAPGGAQPSQPQQQLPRPRTTPRRHHVRP